MLVFAAIGVFGAGMLAIAAGIPIKEFGFGNTLILSGVLAWCTSAVMLTLWVCFRDLKKAFDKPARPPREAESPAAAPRSLQGEAAPSAAGWPESIPERAPPAPSAPLPPPPSEPRAPRRNLLFASNRKPREQAASAGESAIPVAPSGPPLEPRPPAAPAEERPAPLPRRETPLPPRPARPPSALNPRDPVTAPAPLPPPAPPPPAAASPIEAIPPREEPVRAPRGDKPSDVSVLKSGVVDGMAYWLYSDGSIEAQMPEGMMRFTSIDELRAHLDRRP